MDSNGSQTEADEQGRINAGKNSDPSSPAPPKADSDETDSGIVKPGENDVLSGRGNFVNHHTGNENFRKLVKFHKKAYVACPKAQKAIYSKIIYDEIRAMSPPGRFLKQDPQTKLWSTIGEKKALDKTRQALREGAPELVKEMEPRTGGDGKGGKEAKKKSSGPEDFFAQLQTMPGNGRNPFSESLMGNNFPIPMGVNPNPFGVFGAQGPNSILAAAAQLQAAQQQGQQKQPPLMQNQLEAQLQLLKMQMGTQQLANLTAAQQQTNGNNSQSAGFNAMAANAHAQAAQAQAVNNSINLPMGGSNDMTAVFAAMMNSPGANPAAILAYQQQLAQLAMFNQMNAMNVNSKSPFMTGNLNNMNNNGNNGNDSNKLGIENANPKPQQVESKPPSDSSVFTDCSVKGNKRKSEGLNHSFTSIDTISSEKSSKRKNEGLKSNSSFGRAQRIGLKNSLTQRRPNRNLVNGDFQSLNNSMNGLKNSLMSIESLTLNEIDSSGFDGGEKLRSAFEDSDTNMK